MSFDDSVITFFKGDPDAHYHPMTNRDLAPFGCESGGRVKTHGDGGSMRNSPTSSLISKKFDGSPLLGMSRTLLQVYYAFSESTIGATARIFAFACSIYPK